jgi:hypothetical protein
MPAVRDLADALIARQESTPLRGGATKDLLVVGPFTEKIDRAHNSAGAAQGIDDGLPDMVVREEGEGLRH